MALFDKIFDIAKTKDSLDEYLKYHMADINDFYNLPYRTFHFKKTTDLTLIIL